MWAICWQHDIQYTERRINKCTYSDVYTFTVHFSVRNVQYKYADNNTGSVFKIGVYKPGWGIATFSKFYQINWCNLRLRK